MKRVTDWQLDRWQQQGMRWPAYDWVNAVCYTGISALARVSGDSAYYRALYAIGEKLDWNTGAHRTLADDYCIGQTYTELFTTYRQPRILAHFRAQCDTIYSLPHNESLEWTNDIHLREWAWCDALFMGPPGLAALSTVTGDRKYRVMAVRLWWKTTDYLFDKEENLFFRDSRYFHQQEPNGRKMFWSRGNGWVLAGLARLLANLPAREKDILARENGTSTQSDQRAKLIQLYRKMAARISALQQPDGTWRTSLLDPQRYPNKETSGTGLYCYALAWGVNHGLLDRKSYVPVIRRAWAALTNAVQPDGRLGFVQPIGDQPGTSDANSTDAYGVGAFLLAGSEMLPLLSYN
ncbi:glycoside hydrolase family 88 protein [Puia sp.]|uniref:glycoside hydrolase family 88/105 protein n=1 Tax=Puia sp. TaxID=2045100 RepID=UPI002F40758B